jgi:hypothetical protein
MEVLNNIIQGVDKLGSGQLIASIIIALEFAFRMFKSEKPLSIMYLVAGGLKKVGELCSKLGSLLDKVLPQRLK